MLSGVAKILNYFNIFNLLDIIMILLDIIVVSFIIYKLILVLKGTRAVQLIKGLFVLVVVYFISDIFGLTSLNWILKQVQLMIVVALPIVFQPELRRALEQLGRGKIFMKSIPFLAAEDMSRLINELIRTAQVLSDKKHGALIVIERTTGLNDYIETGIKIDAIASIELMVNIFVPSTPLHDGAIIINGDRIAAAGCFLPLTDSPYLSKQLGTRHRAALGITENSDSIAVIVSEETGTISVANDGELTRYLEEDNLKEILEELLIVKDDSNHFSWFSKKK